MLCQLYTAHWSFILTELQWGRFYSPLHPTRDGSASAWEQHRLGVTA